MIITMNWKFHSFELIWFGWLIIGRSVRIIEEEKNSCISKSSFGIWLEDVKAYIGHFLTWQNRVMQNSSEVVSTVSHCVHVSSILEKNQNSFHSTWWSSVSHQRCQAWTVTGFCVGSEVQEKFKWFDIVGQVDLSTEEITFIGVSTTFKKQSSYILEPFVVRKEFHSLVLSTYIMFVSQSKSQRFIAQSCSWKDFFCWFAVVNLGTAIKKDLTDLMISMFGSEMQSGIATVIDFINIGASN